MLQVCGKVMLILWPLLVPLTACRFASTRLAFVHQQDIAATVPLADWVADFSAVADE